MAQKNKNVPDFICQSPPQSTRLIHSVVCSCSTASSLLSNTSSINADTISSFKGCDEASIFLLSVCSCISDDVSLIVGYGGALLCNWLTGHWKVNLYKLFEDCVSCILIECWTIVYLTSPEPSNFGNNSLIFHPISK